jgi:hypothetical protein
MMEFKTDAFDITLNEAKSLLKRKNISVKTDIKDKMVAVDWRRDDVITFLEKSDIIKLEVVKSAPYKLVFSSGKKIFIAKVHEGLVQKLYKKYNRA